MSYETLLTERHPLGLRLLAVLSFVGIFGCQSPPKKTQPKASKSTARKAPVAARFVSNSSSAMERYAPGVTPSIPSLGFTIEAKQKTQRQPDVTLVVRLLSSGIAIDGNADDWVGFKPGERFYTARFTKEKDPKLANLTFRIKVENPKAGTALLGQEVTITGHWMFGQDEAEKAEAFAQKQRGVRFVPRRGQDLFEAAQRIQDQRMEAFSQKSNAGLVQPDKSMNSKKTSSEVSTMKRLPLFYARSVKALVKQRP